MIVYVDILLIVNLFINYFLLLGTMLLSHLQKRRLRILAGAFVGSLFSLMIFAPNFGYIITFLYKIVLGCALIFITFGRQKMRVYLKTLLLFFAVNFIFAGVMLFLWFVVRPEKMLFHNGIVYFDISPIFLVFSTVVAYLMIKGVYWLFNRKVETGQLCHITIEEGDKTVQFMGFSDTGNRLTDPFSGLPVTVCEFSVVQSLIPEELHSFFLDPAKAQLSQFDTHPWRRKIRIIPYSTVGSPGVMAAFEPDGVYYSSHGIEKKEEVLIGVTSSKLSDGEYQAVINTHSV